MLPAEHRVAHRTAHQGQLVAGLAEPPAELVDHRRDPVQLRAPPSAAPRRSGGEAGRRRTRQATLSAAARPAAAASPRRRRTAATVVAMLRPLSLLPALVAVLATSVATAAAGAGRRPAVGRHVRGRARCRRPAAPGPDRRPRPRREQGPARGHHRRAHPVVPSRAGPDPGQRLGHQPEPRTRSPRSTSTRSCPMRRSRPAPSWPRAPTLDPERVRRRPDHRPPGTFDHLDELAPGESSTFTIRVPRSREISRGRASTPGVYWFGVHALGDSVIAPRRHRRRPGPHVPPARAADDQAAGRHRPGDPAPAPGPARGRRQHRGRRRLGRDPVARAARCARLVDFGASAGHPSGQLAGRPRGARRGAGARRRQPAAVARRHDAARTSPARASARPASPTAEPEPSESDDATTRTRGAAADDQRRDRARLDLAEQVQDAMAGDEILALPYGDLDVSAAAEHDPRGLRARRAAQRATPWSRGASPPRPRSPRRAATSTRRPSSCPRGTRRSWSPTGCSPRRRRRSPGSAGASLTVDLVGRPSRAARARRPLSPPSPCASGSSARPRSALLDPDAAAAGRRAAAELATRTAPSGSSAASTSTGST